MSGIPADEIIFNDPELIINFKALASGFNGKISADRKTLEGEWKLQKMTAPLKLEKAEGKSPKKARPQDPVKPYPYVEEEVSYQNTKAGITLAGTLTMPKSGGSFTTVLLITGSGQQDRNEEVFNHRPFHVLADHLTRQGIAVLRVDDRGIGGSTGDFKNSTTLDFADDVRAGINYLKSRKEINPDRIGLIGHSEGGMIAPMVAADSDEVSFIVLMAGPGVSGKKLLILQSTYFSRTRGVGERAIELTNQFSELLYDVIESESANDVAEEKMFSKAREFINALSEKDQELLDIDVDKIGPQVKQFLSPMMRCWLFIEPAEWLSKVSCPVLAINGGKDTLVPPKENLTAIENALKSGGNTKYTIKVFEEMNHAFQKAQTGLPPEVATIEETISPEVLALLGDWIKALYPE